jgi:hypothetical protein
MLYNNGWFTKMIPTIFFQLIKTHEKLVAKSPIDLFKADVIPLAVRSVDVFFGKSKIDKVHSRVLIY